MMPHSELLQPWCCGPTRYDPHTQIIEFTNSIQVAPTGSKYFAIIDCLIFSVQCLFQQCLSLILSSPLEIQYTFTWLLTGVT